VRIVFGRLGGRAAGAAAVAAAVAALSGACAPPAPEAAGPARAAALYVADGLDGTVTRLDGAGGRRLGAPLPVGAHPEQVVVAPGGAALVLTRDAAAAPGDPAGGQSAGLTYVSRDGVRGGWVARPVALGPGARALLLAGDGDAHAVALYTVAPVGPPEPPGPPGPSGSPAEAPCGVAVIDLRTGTVEATHPVCTFRELPTGVALERAAGGAVVSLVLWHRATPPGRDLLPAGARLVRLAARTGTLLGEAPLSGLPRPPAHGGSLLRAPGPDGADRLYVVEALPDSRLATWGEAEYAWQYPLSAGWRLHRLAPGGLEAEAGLPLAFAPAGLAVAADGTRAYAFDALGDAVLALDLTTGRAAPLARVPGHRPFGLAVGGDRLYVASPPAGRVLALDRATGRRVLTLRAGRAPAGIALAP